MIFTLFSMSYSILPILIVQYETVTYELSPPGYRVKHDCGRMAAYCFGNLFKQISLSDATRIQVSENGTAIGDIRSFLSQEGVATYVGFASPKSLNNSHFPGIHLLNLQGEHHYAVILDYDASRDEYVIFDQDTGVVVKRSGSFVRLRHTGYFIALDKIYTHFSVAALSGLCLGLVWLSAKLMFLRFF